MSGESNLHVLLASMEPVLQPDEYVFCTVTEPRSASGDLEAICTFRENEGFTLIVTRAEAERRSLAFTYPCRMITLTVHSSLSAVGFLAAITQKLASVGISVNPVSAFYHDHLFVPSEKVDQAMVLLREFKQNS